MSSGTIGNDVLDTSRCAQFAVQVTSVSGSGTFKVQHTIDGENWADLVSLGTSLGTIFRFSAATGPYAKIRLKVVDSATVFTLVGFSMSGTN